mgnify:CR=1 FL=1
MARIRLATEFADSIKQVLVDHHNSTNRVPDDKIHVSDLLAPRFTYYYKKNGRVTRSEDIDMFIPGTAFHELIQKAYKKVNPEAIAEASLELDGIVGHLDLLVKFVTEIKTSRKYTIPEMPDEHYVKQAKYYMVLAEVLEAYIVVVYFTAGRNPWKKKPSTLEIIAWKVDITEEERNDLYNEMINTKESIETAVNLGKPGMLPLCEMFRCGSVYKGEVQRTCAYYNTCKPDGRYPEEQLIKVAKK